MERVAPLVEEVGQAVAGSLASETALLTLVPSVRASRRSYPAQFLPLGGVPPAPRSPAAVGP